LRESYSQFEQRGAHLLVVSSTELEMTSFVAETLRAPFPVLSDGSWSVFYRYGMGSAMGVPLPGTFVIDADGVIRWSWVAPLSVVFTPPPPDTLLEALDALAPARG
jgi:peroxiredoxin